MKRCKHKWGEIGQTNTMNVRTIIDWCKLCGTLYFHRIAWDYKGWYKRIKKD